MDLSLRSSSVIQEIVSIVEGYLEAFLSGNGSAEAPREPVSLEELEE